MSGLWIAFKSLYLWYSEQQNLTEEQTELSCELLSKVCIFDILSNKAYEKKHWKHVVNCFQKFVSLIFWATRTRSDQPWDELWIAFKSLYLWYSEQQNLTDEQANLSCELLSKVCIFDILSNTGISTKIIMQVVNCFQKFVSLIFWATQYF